MHPNGKPEAPSLAAKINIGFISAAPQNFPVKRPMLTLTIGTKNNSLIPGLFQIAAQIEIPVTLAIGKPATVVTEKEFAAVRMEALKSMGSESKNPSKKAGGGGVRLAFQNPDRMFACQPLRRTE